MFVLFLNPCTLRGLTINQRSLTMRIVLLLAALTLSASLYAQDKKAPASGFRAEFLMHLDQMEKKYTDMANTIPADKYGYRPAEGVRSIGEVLMHCAGGNYFLLGFIGVKSDTPMNENFEKNADPKKATETIKASFALVRNTVLNMSDADMDKTVKFFGGKDASIRNVLFTTMNHQHEHLGQLIAYARANGITPPWSAN